MERHARGASVSEAAQGLPTHHAPRERSGSATTPGDARVGVSTVLWLGAWYGTSLGTLVLNKVLLTEHGYSSQTLGVAQMLCTAVFGAVKVYASARAEQPPALKKPLASSANLAALEQAAEAGGPPLKGLRRILLAMGLLRATTVVLGLVSLAHVAASFTETIKSTAPLFTVYISWLILGQRTSGPVVASLVPVMLGLVVCAKTEVSFNAIGFWAAVSNNVIDCAQNVLSKKVVGRLGPVRLQFYTSILAIIFQLPLILYRELEQMPTLAHLLAASDHIAKRVPWAAADAADASAAAPESDPFLFRLPSARQRYVLLLFFCNVSSYHLQSVSAYFVVDKLSPVTVSVANTLKRALLILLTIAYFGNEMTAESFFGVGVVVAGVFLYNWARVRYPADAPPPPTSSPHHRPARLERPGPGPPPPPPLPPSAVGGLASPAHPRSSAPPLW